MPNNTIRIIIQTEPTPKGRAITTFKQGHLWTFTPEATMHAEEYIRWKIMRHALEFGFKRGIPVKMSCTFFKTRPKYLHSKERMPSKHPDSDNYLKLLLDAINQVLVWDDGQITTLHCRKRFSDKSYGYITLKLEEDLI
jgi:Holliday junction resolvase RusA-like endonuclease